MQSKATVSIKNLGQ